MIIVSIDTETRAETPYLAALASIGIYACELETGKKLGDLHIRIEQNPKVPGNALEYGIKDPQTNRWWLKQSEEARKELEGHTLVTDAMNQVTALIDAIKLALGTDNLIFVARSPSFDLTILNRLFYLLKMESPFNHRLERDHRTFEQAWRMVAEAKGQPFLAYRDWNEVKHNALDDAEQQALYLVALYQQIQ